MSETKEMTKVDEKNLAETRSLRPAIPAVDIYENDDEIILHADMPGVMKNDITVNIDNGTLSLSGKKVLDHGAKTVWEEFGDVEYIRNFSVPQSIDVEKVEAQLSDGVLKLHLPKSEAAKPRQIEISAA